MLLPLLSTCSDDEKPQTLQFEARMGEVSESPHFIVASGEAAKSALFATDMDWQAMYDGVQSIGARPGYDESDLNGDAWRSALMDQGTEMDAVVSWTDAQGKVQTISVAELLAISSGSAPSSGTVDLRFTGNNKQQAGQSPGHRMCATSCPFGVVTNASLPNAASDTHSFSAKGATFPPAGSSIQVSLGVRGGVRGGVRVAPGPR